jgi:hypothetical protein
VGIGVGIGLGVALIVIVIASAVLCLKRSLKHRANVNVPQMILEIDGHNVQELPETGI